MNILQNKLHAYKDASGLPQDVIAKELNVSRAALSSWLKGKYKGNNEEFTEKVVLYLEQNQRHHAEVQSVKMDFDFIRTSVYDTIYDAVMVSEAYQQIRVIVGDSGVGKTIALTRIHELRQNTIYLPVYKGIRKNRFMEKLCEAANIPSGGAFDTKFELLIQNLRKTNRLIIVDEAEHLPIDAVDALRRINDFTGSCVILAGLPIFLDRLAKYADYTYIFNRMAIPIRLKRLSERDTAQMVKTMLPENCSITDVEWAKSSNNLGRNLKTIVQEGLRVAKLNNISPSNSDRFRSVIRKVTQEMSYQLMR